MNENNQTGSWVAGNPALWERLELINPESYADVRSAWEAQDVDKTLFALWDYMNPEADPYKGISSIIEAYGSKAVLCELGVPEDQAEKAVGDDIMKNPDIDFPDVSLGDALEQGIESVVGGIEGEVDPGIDEDEQLRNVERPFEPVEEYDPDPKDTPVYQPDFGSDDINNDEYPHVEKEDANSASGNDAEANHNPDKIDSENVEQFIKEVLGEDGAAEIENILKESLSPEDYQAFLDACNHAKLAKDDGRPEEEVSQIIRDWADGQKTTQEETGKQDTDAKDADDPMREQYIEKMNEAREKKSEQIPYFRDTFFAYYDMKEKYYAMKADIPLNGKPVSKADFTVSVMRFLNSNIFETMILRLIDSYSDKKEKDNGPDIDRNHEDRQDRNMGAKDDVGAYDNGYAKNVDKTEADAARTAGNTEYGQFFGANTAGNTDKQFSREDRTVWNTKPLVEFAPRISADERTISRAQHIPEMRTVEVGGNFYLVNPFGKVEATKIYHQDNVIKSFPDMDVTRYNDTLVTRMSEVATDRGLTLDQYKAEIEVRCKEAFANRIESQWEGESQRLGSLAESIKGDIGTLKEQIKNVDLQGQKIEAGNLSDTEKGKMLAEVSDIRKGLENGLEKAQNRLDNVEKYKEYIDYAKGIADKSDIDSRFSRAAIGESMAAGRAENVEYASGDTYEKLQQLLEHEPEKQDVDNDSSKPEVDNDAGKQEAAPDNEQTDQPDRGEEKQDNVDKNEDSQNKDAAAADKDEKEQEQVDAGEQNSTADSNNADFKQDDEKDVEPLNHDDVDAGENKEETAPSTNVEKADPEEEEKIDDVGAGAEEEETLVEVERDDPNKETDGADQHIEVSQDAGDTEKSENIEIETGDRHPGDNRDDDHRGSVDKVIDTINDFIDNKADFIDVLESIQGLDFKDILYDFANTLLPEEAMDKIEGIMDLFMDIHDLFSISISDLIDSFFGGFDNISADQFNTLSDAFENALAETIQEADQFEGIVTIGEQTLGFGEETGIVDLHTGETVDGFNTDGAIENLINDVARDTDMSLRELEQPDMNDVETGQEFDPVSADELGGQGLAQDNNLGSTGLDADELGADIFETPVAQTGAEEVAAEASEIEEVAAILL